MPMNQCQLLPYLQHPKWVNCDTMHRFFKTHSFCQALILLDFLMFFSLLIYNSDWCRELVEVAQAELNEKEIQKTWVACQRHVGSCSQSIPWWFPGNVKEEWWQDWAMAVLLVRADSVLWSDGNDGQCPDHTAEIFIEALNNPKVLPLIEEFNAYIVDCIYHPKHK